MAYYTKVEARAAAQASRHSHQKSAERLLTEASVAISESDRFDVFLSHSIRDAELVAGILQILEAQGFRVYVDWDTDAGLDRKAVNKNTADVLRKRMRQSRSLIYIATENATTSKWMPWELGFFDAHSPGQVAVLPLMENRDDAFPEQEYLALYPQVTKDKYTNGLEDVFVEDKGRRWTTLKLFGRGSNAWYSYSA